MKDPLRVIVGVFGVLTAYAAIAFYFRWPIVEDLWPWKGYDAQLSPLSFYFVSSIMAAISAPLIWLAATNRMRAAGGGALNLIVAFSAIAVYMFLGSLRDRANTALLVGGVLFAVSVVLTGVIGARVRKVPFQDTRPMPRTVFVSFIVFVVALVLVGGALVLRVPDILPWSLSEEASVVYGWVFLGAACYFAFGLRTPLWENATGQLLGFLAYDLVLILPFIRHFQVVPDSLRINLILYTAVVVYSGLLAIYFCFLDPRMRIVRPVSATPPAPPPAAPA